MKKSQEFYIILTKLSHCIPTSESVEKEIEAKELSDNNISDWLCTLP